MSIVPRLALLAGTVVLVASCSSGGDDVEVGAVTRADVVEIVTAAGTVSPRSQAVLTSPADDAVVSSVLIHEGQRVLAGDVIAQLSSPSAQQRLLAAQQKLSKTPAPKSATTVDLRAFAKQLDASAQASFASARAAASQIQDPNARAQAMAQIAQSQKSFNASRAAADKAIKQTEQGIADASAAVQSLQAAQHDAAVASVAAAQAAVNALTIRAPFAGTATLGGPAQTGTSSVDLSGIAQSLSSGAGADLGGSDLTSALTGGGSAPVTAQIEEGAHVGQGTPIATVVDASSLSIVSNVDETDILAVGLGDPVSVELDAVPGAKYPGTITQVDQLPATSSGGSVTYRVRSTLRSGVAPDGHQAPKPRAGMSAVASITVRTSKDALAVPAAAIVRDTSGQESVWIVRSGHAHLVSVKLGAQGQDTVAIDSGVSQGDRVVVKGADSVKEGKKLS